MVRRSILTLALGSLAVAAMSQGPVSVYDFDGHLNAVVAGNGNVGSLEFRNGGFPTSAGGSPVYSLETVGSVSKQVAHFDADNLFRALHGLGKNGGGNYVNQYSILLDVKFTDTSSGWASLYNTNDDNTNDGEAYIDWASGGIGINGSYAGSVSANAWNRIIVTVNTTGSGTELAYYVNGALANSVSLGDPIDGRFSMYSADDPDVGIDHVDLLAEPFGYHSAGQVSQAAFWNVALSAQVAMSLGGPGSVVPEPATLAVLGLGVALLRRRK